MDKAEQPTITRADRSAAWPYRPSCYETGAKSMWMTGIYDNVAPIIKAFARHRTTSLAAQVDPIEHVASTNSMFQVMDVDGLNRWREHASEGGGHDMASLNKNSLRRLIGTIDKLAAMASAPSLAAQDGLDDHFPSGLRQRSHQIATAGDVVDGPVCVDCHCGASFSATDEGEARQLWASHAMAAMERPKTAAQDGLVEALDDSTIDEIILNFAGGVVQVPSEHNPRGYVSYYRPREAMRKALSAIKEQHHD